MNLQLILGISVGIYLAYVIFKKISAQNAVNSDYRQRMRDLLTNKKYQVKGKFD